MKVTNNFSAAHAPLVLLQPALAHAAKHGEERHKKNIGVKKAARPWPPTRTTPAALLLTLPPPNRHRRPSKTLLYHRMPPADQRNQRRHRLAASNTTQDGPPPAISPIATRPWRPTPPPSTAGLRYLRPQIHRKWPLPSLLYRRWSQNNERNRRRRRFATT